MSIEDSIRKLSLLYQQRGLPSIQRNLQAPAGEREIAQCISQFNKFHPETRSDLESLYRFANGCSKVDPPSVFPWDWYSLAGSWEAREKVVLDDWFDLISDNEDLEIEVEDGKSELIGSLVTSFVLGGYSGASWVFVETTGKAAGRVFVIDVDGSGCVIAPSLREHFSDLVAGISADAYPINEECTDFDYPDRWSDRWLGRKSAALR